MEAGAIPELRISDIPLTPSGPWRRVELTWQDGTTRQIARSEFAFETDYRDDEKIRWYLEDYAAFPADPAPAFAREAEDMLKQVGVGLFQQVFSSRAAAGIWQRARGQLDQVRIEVDIKRAGGPGLPWELLRDPATDLVLARAARAFVRTGMQAAHHPRPLEAAGDRLRVLLVICRPSGPDDVPFRSVARRLVRVEAESVQGLDLDVLRPATFPRLSQVLEAAAAAGRPYHVVHFDGHGDYLNQADLEQHQEADDGVQVPAGPHGYLIFENPSNDMNEDFVGGLRLGNLLTAAQVPVLVLNACRSAYSEAQPLPAGPAAEEDGTESGQSPGLLSSRKAAAGLTADAYARIRAAGPLAAEIAAAGVPGVVAMRYNIYAVTAARFVADLYAHLLAGNALGEATTAARRALAEDPARLVGADPVLLQDWTVPVVYEAAPLTLLQPPVRELPPQRSTPAGSTRYRRMRKVPHPPDAGFVGMDETLLAVDRSFDDDHIVLLHGYAGAGKSSIAAEFAYWYETTGGLAPLGHPEAKTRPVLWSSFEQHLPLDRLLDTIGRHFTGLLNEDGIGWDAITDSAQRRDMVLRVLADVPVLWVWDQVEQVNGYPPGSGSAWTAAEQAALAAFLRALAATRCRVLLTSRRDERPWLGGLPVRILLPSMPMSESLELAVAVAAGHGHQADGQECRQLLRYCGGNPLTITVLTSQALRGHVPTARPLAAFARRLDAGDEELEAAEDAARGRPGHWPRPCPTVSTTHSPAPNVTSSRCCTCSAVPSAPQPCRAWATPRSPVTPRCRSWLGSPRARRSGC